MLTQQQRDTFRLALASFDRDNLDIDDDEIIETASTIDDFFKGHVRVFNPHGEIPEVPYEEIKTLAGVIYIWYDWENRRDFCLGNLYAMDFGTVRAAYFDGEI
jgi:hypothetical protein